MPAGGNNGGSGTPTNGDILNALSGDVTLIHSDTTAIKDNTQILAEMNENIEEILKEVGHWSQQDARSRIYDTSNRNRNRSGSDSGSDSGSRFSRNDDWRRRSRNAARNSGKPEEFIDGFFEELQAGILGSNFRGMMQQNMKEFANAMGLQVQDLPSAFGKHLANQLKQTQLGKDVTARLNGAIEGLFNKSLERVKSGIGNYYDRQRQNGQMSDGDALGQQLRWDEVLEKIRNNFENRNNPPRESNNGGSSGGQGGPEGPGGGPDIGPDLSGSVDDIVNNLLGEGDSLINLLGGLSGSTLDVGAGLAGVASAALPVIAVAGAVVAGLWLLDKAIDKFQACFKPLQESFENLTSQFSKISNRYFESEKQNIKRRTERLQSDVELMIKKPFEIMESAAEDWYNAWDSNLRTINATQGYTKADLQNLMSNYSQRLRQENLQSVVSAADISNNLAKVLESGLSGKVAEEFAYLATILNNAIPTQDFFSYASTYASIAANQIAQGKSQSAAIEAANQQLTQFASSLLYANRELTGGFSTGLSDAASILESAVKIANTAGVADSSYISATLTAVSSIVGAIAPDLSGSITEAIIEAALGGNSDNLVALRSLANTGASNTAFLNAFARDPKGVLTTLFTNLSNMQNMNTVNFMEVAESLADTFGLSISALTRVDFASLAQSVSNIDINMNSLNANMKLLQEGQTTTTAEQLKMNQVNEMILNEGLSYVLDNQAARAIQQHMWDQEIAAEMQEATYGVELQGAALEFLSGIAETIKNILKFLNPFSFLGDIFEIAAANEEAKDLKLDIKKVLEAGKVGSGNAKSLYNLTTYDVDKLTNKPGNLATMMGLQSSYASDRAVGAVLRSLFGNPVISAGITRNAISKLFTNGYGAIDSLIKSSSSSGPSSQYNFVTKGLNNALSNISFARSTSQAASTVSPTLAATTTSAQSSIDAKSMANLQSFLNSMEDYVSEDRSYDEWLNSASKYGIVKLEQALEEFDITMQDVQSKYQEYQAAKSTEYSYNKDQQEIELWNTLNEFIHEDIAQYFEGITTRQDTQTEILQTLNTTLVDFVNSWRNDWLAGAWSRDWLQNAWRTEWISGAWQTEWLNNAWRTEWLQDAWRTEWLNTNWAEKWINQAWYQDWINKAWYQDWIENAWNNGFIQMWRTEWLEKAWKQDWLENAWRQEWIKDSWQTAWIENAWNDSWLNKAWGEAWLENAWNTDWLENAWRQEWLDVAWRQDWLEQAWKNDWLSKSWEARWLQEEWHQNWLENAWNEDWLQNAWGQDWLKEYWEKLWIEGAFKGSFIRDNLNLLWGNRWMEFFNIFRDRFGGLETAKTDGIEFGETKFNTEGLYRIYTEETGKAAENALKEVEQTDTTGDAILALTKQLTKNDVDLKDPQVQTNVLLSQILIVLEAIMQAQNITGGGASVATTLAGLGLGLTTPNTSEVIGL